MTGFFLAAAAVLLISAAAGFWRVFRGPTAADRMMAAQLVGTGGVGIVLLLAAAEARWAMLDAALRPSRRGGLMAALLVLPLALAFGA